MAEKMTPIPVDAAKANEAPPLAQQPAQQHASEDDERVLRLELHLEADQQREQPKPHHHGLA